MWRESPAVVHEMEEEHRICLTRGGFLYPFSSRKGSKDEEGLYLYRERLDALPTFSSRKSSKDEDGLLRFANSRLSLGKI